MSQHRLDLALGFAQADLAGHQLGKEEIAGLGEDLGFFAACLYLQSGVSCGSLLDAPYACTAPIFPRVMLNGAGGSWRSSPLPSRRSVVAARGCRCGLNLPRDAALCDAPCEQGGMAGEALDQQHSHVALVTIADWGVVRRGNGPLASRQPIAEAPSLRRCACAPWDGDKVACSRLPTVRVVD